MDRCGSRGGRAACECAATAPPVSADPTRRLGGRGGVLGTTAPSPPTAATGQLRVGGDSGQGEGYSGAEGPFCVQPDDRCGGRGCQYRPEVVGWGQYRWAQRFTLARGRIGQSSKCP